MFLKNRSLMLGVDVGGSHITASFVDLVNQWIISDSIFRSKVDMHGSANEILDTWVSTIRNAIGPYPANSVKIGIAMPGPFDYENGISLIKGMNKYESLYQVDILSHLSKALEIDKEKILFRNDAEAFLHGEVYCGAVKGYSKAIGITLGTGLGSAIHTDGFTADANLGISAFKDGIAEDYLSTRWFVKRYQELSDNTIKDAKTIFDTVGTDQSSDVVLDEFTTNLSNFLHSFIIREKPQAVVIGGNIAKAHALFLDVVNAKLVKLGCLVPIKVTSLWEDAAIIGAACYWNSSVVEK
jgi:glucokinase